MEFDDFSEKLEKLLQVVDGTQAANELRNCLMVDGFVDHLLSGPWGDSQTALSRIMRNAFLANVVMGHSDEQLRSEAADWLLEIQDESARLVLIDRAAHDQAELVRAGAAEAMADHAPRTQLSSAAKHLLSDEEVLVRSLAVVAAMQQGLTDEVRATLATESERRVIVSAHCALANHGDDASINELYSMLGDSDYIVRYSAMNGLAGVVSVRDTPRFRDAVSVLAMDSARAVSVRAREICCELGVPAGPSL